MRTQEWVTTKATFTYLAPNQRVSDSMVHRASRHQLLVPNIWITCRASGSFNLRGWTDQYEDWIQVRSDLAVAFDEALIRENIAVA